MTLPPLTRDVTCSVILIGRKKYEQATSDEYPTDLGIIHMSFNCHCSVYLSFISHTLREKCPYSEFFWSVFSRIRTEYGEILRTSAYSVQMWENTDQKKLRIWTLFTQCSLLVLIVDPLGLPCFMLGTIWSTQMTKLIS